MKKGMHLLLAALVITVVIIPIGGEERRTAFDELLPYQQVLDKINRELGSSIHIPEGTEEQVYQNVKKKFKNLDEFEAEMRREYLETLTQNSTAQEKSTGESSVKGNSGDLDAVPPLPNASGSVTVVPLQ